MLNYTGKDHHYFCNQGQIIQLSQASKIHVCLQGHFSLDKGYAIMVLNRIENHAAHENSWWKGIFSS